MRVNTLYLTIMTTVSRNFEAHLSIPVSTRTLAGLTAAAVAEGLDLNTYANMILEREAEKGYSHQNPQQEAGQPEADA